MATTSPSNPVYTLAFFFWHDICENKGNNPHMDPQFKMHLAHASKVLKEKYDYRTMRYALSDFLSVKNSPPFNLLQVIKWVRPGSNGKTFYQVAQERVEQELLPPPVWDTFAYAEWCHKREKKYEQVALL